MGLADRISFVIGEEGRRGWDKLLSQVDILLDMSLIGGTLSTCDALWMGVPVVTLASGGQRWNCGASILTAAGCEGWVAENEQDFVDIAQRLLDDRAELIKLKSSLNQRIKMSPLCDLPGFASRMETGLREAIISIRKA